MSGIFNRKVFDQLDLVARPAINFVDIGCHKGHYLSQVKSLGLKTPLITVGVDPCDYGIHSKYNYFINKAVDHVTVPGVQKFFEYIEPGCNSLLEMKTDKITHNVEEKNSKWYVAATIEKVTKIREVPVDSLDSILNSIGWAVETPIHFMKIDTQGKDLDVIKSLGPRLRYLHYVQIEAVSSHDPENTLYKNQSLMEKDIYEMKALGFEVLSICDYSANASPEADVIFYNESIADLKI